MDNPVATIYCSSSLCQAPNPETHRFCQKCRTPLPKRYLWVANSGAVKLTPGTLLRNRYYVKSQQVLLDTQSAQEPEIPKKIPPPVEAYLHLSALYPHIPAAYTCLVLESDSRTNSAVLLLEGAPLRIEVPHAGDNKQGVTSPNPGQSEIAISPMPALLTAWEKASAFRQLNWLWQMARLWQPLMAERAAASLLHPPFLRVEGSLLRLLELRIDDPETAEASSPTLVQLGQLWQQWIPKARPSIRRFLETLCQQLTQEELLIADQVVTQLDRGLEACARSQNRQIRIANYTDQGPSRQRNEDACYPPNGSQVVRPPGLETLTIVCDGIGGHEGGNVASNLTIEAVKKHLQTNLKSPESRADANRIITELNRATLQANDVISQQNDSEQREGRKRMGTTLVMALACDREIYITHVGDSRAYLILPTNCHQITLDDDVASREARLGYAFYREVVQRPAAGSLVQALGMSHSRMLHPTIQRFLLDEDCIYLLCSDGLSDNDRVEQYWETEILPLLQGQRNPAQVGQRLVELANTRNGHDNVTVSVIHCQMRSSPNEPELSPDLLATIPPLGVMMTGEASFEVDKEAASAQPPAAEEPTAKTPKTDTEIVPAAQQIASRNSALPLILLLGLFVAVGAGLLAYWLLPEFRTSLRLDPSPQPETVPSAEPTADTNAPIPLQSLQVGQLIQLQLAGGVAPQTTQILLRQKPDSASAETAEQPFAILLPGSVVKVRSIRQGVEEQDAWLEVSLCTAPDAQTSNETTATSPTPNTDSIPAPPQPNASASPAPPDNLGKTPETENAGQLGQPGQVGWVRDSEVLALPAPTNIDSSTACSQ